MLIGDTLIAEFLTVNPNTGAGLNADSLPIGLLRKNGTTVGGATVTVTALSLGRYTASVYIDAAHGWAVGDSYSLEIESTVQGVSNIFNTAAQGFIEEDIVTSVDALLTAIKGAGWTNETLKGIYDHISTRLATAGYTAPDNTGIAAIQAITDAINFVAGDVVATLDGEQVDIDAGSSSEIDAQLTASHGAGKWGAPGAGAGQYLINVNVVTDEVGSPALPGAIITIQDALDNVIRWGETDTNGDLAIAVDDGTYSLLISAGPRYQPFTPASVVVSGANVDRNETLVLQTATPPSTPELCTVYAYEYLNGSPVKNRVISAQMTALPQKGSSIIYEAGPVTVRTAADGYWELALVRGKDYVFTVSQAGLKKTITIPAQASYDLTNSLA